MKSVYLSITVIIVITILFVPQTVFGQFTYEQVLEKLNANTTRMDKLVRDGAILITTQTLNKTEYQLGENIIVHPKLTNIGNHSLNIGYLWRPFFVVVNYPNGTTAWGGGPFTPPMEFKWNYNQTLNPNVPFTTADKIHPNSSYYSVKLSTYGNYTISSVADFYDVNDNGTHRIFVWSKPLQITVLPEKVPEFPFAIIILIITTFSIVVISRMRCIF